ncbi:FAD-dependent oxidoreductase [Sphingomonas cavernae]|uniref:3-oxosteroid 1-dehydrogenase n=1 Tax=Sphingomonas cavernae TaxID=2320861 RepID=A0A418WPH3_9SPHN|nr:FAD-dependent oxidoreductase [Sphingomonas cavernae]RJF93152.1 FAD-binding protein [Sphingomonas cavernae]
MEAIHEVDVLVVGSGAGALTAAFTAADAGANVLVVEKAAKFGGTSATSGGGIWIPNSADARAQGHADDPQEALDYIKALIGDDVPEVKLEAYVDNAHRMLSYMEERSELRYTAYAYADYHMDVAGARNGWRTHDPIPLMADSLGEDFWRMEPPHTLTLTFGRFTWTMEEAKLLLTMSPGAKPLLFKLMLKYMCDLPWRFKTKRSRRLTGGNALVGRLKLSLDKKGVPIWLDAPMTSLLNGKGGVTGATVERNGKRIEIHARKGVILASGGFDHDAALRTKYSPKPASADWSAGVPSNTGDGLKAGMAAGAATGLMDSAWWGPGFMLEGEDRARIMFVERALPSSIIVNQAGKRYMNEAASYHVAGGEMHRCNNAEAPTVPSWFVFDARYRSKYMLGPMMAGKPSADSRIPEPMRKILKKADTIEGLAAQMGVEPNAFAATVARFNEAAIRGEDPDFGRGQSAYDRHYGDASVTPNPTLAPIERGPFYAIAIYPCDLGTNGGLQTDEKARVLAEDGKPIAGLYAVGNVSAAAMGRTYPGAGATLGPAMTFGWIAARDIMRVND